MDLLTYLDTFIYPGLKLSTAYSTKNIFEKYITNKLYTVATSGAIKPGGIYILTFRLIGVVYVSVSFKYLSIF